MDTKDSFWSRAYRGGYIQGCHNRTQRTEEIRAVFANGNVRYVKSVRAAQLLLNAASKAQPISCA